MTPIPPLVAGQWTEIARRPRTSPSWRWSHGWEESAVRYAADTHALVLMHRHEDTAVILVCQPMTAAWRRVLRWAFYR